MKKLILILTLTITSIFSYSQTTFKHKVKVKIEPSNEFSILNEYEKGDMIIYEIVNQRENDTLKLKKGYKLTKSKSRNVNGINYEQKKDSLIKDNSNIVFKKNISKAKRTAFTPGKYDANISVSKDSLLINFWLEIINGKSYYKSKDKSNFNFNPQSKYFIKLKNRQSQTFTFTNYELGALTIPFKYHFGFKKNNQKIDPIFTTNVNINTFIGTRIGKITYVYDKYDGMKTFNNSVSFGGFIGLGSQKLDSITTSLAPIPLEKEVNVPTLSFGIGALANISDFNLGLFYGWDKTLGSNGKKWNYRNKSWLGFGFGYKIAILSKESE